MKCIWRGCKNVTPSVVRLKTLPNGISQPFSSNWLQKARRISYSQCQVIVLMASNVMISQLEGQQVFWIRGFLIRENLFLPLTNPDKVYLRNLTLTSTIWHKLPLKSSKTVSSQAVQLRHLPEGIFAELQEVRTLFWMYFDVMISQFS